MYDQELERFKSDIALVHFAVDCYGYRRDRRESSRASHVLRQRATNDKIIVRKDVDGHWTYFSVRDERDNGTIIDFVRARGHCASLAGIRDELRQWLGTPRPEPHYLHEHVAVPRDRHAVARAFDAAKTADNSPYLNARGIRPETLRDRRFAGTWGLDARGNTLFVHTTDAGEVTGFETKSRGFTRFSTGGTKSAWQSAIFSDDRALVITESAIDGLSYFQLRADKALRARFLSTAGAPSRHQMELLERVCAKLAPACAVVGAVDSDAAGDKLASRLEDIVRRCPHLSFERDSPTLAKDWNDVLQRKERAIEPARRVARNLERGR